MLKLSQRINILEQKSLECHVELIGVPEIPNEICINTVAKIASTLGLEMKVKMLLSYHQSSRINLGRFKPVKSVKEKRTVMDLWDLMRKMKILAKHINDKWNNK